MKQTIFFILTLTVLISCSKKIEKSQNETEEENFIEQLDSISAQELEELIKFPVRNKFDKSIVDTILLRLANKVKKF